MCNAQRRKEGNYALRKNVTEGNEKVHELAKDGAMLDGGEMAHAALQYAASFHCLVEEGHDCEELKPKPKEQWIFGDKKMEAKTQCTECVQQRANIAA